MQGIATLRRYLENEVAAGTLVIDDCEVAAAQFLDVPAGQRPSSRCSSTRPIHRPTSASTMSSASRSVRSLRPMRVDDIEMIAQKIEQRRAASYSFQAEPKSRN
jgi:hypothetical protein